MTAKRGKSYSRLIIAGVVAFAVWFGLFSGYGALTRWRLEAECDNITRQINMNSIAADSLRAYAKTLLNDSLEIERIARERYGMIKPGEKVYIIRREE